MSHFVLLSYTGVLLGAESRENYATGSICNCGMQLWGRVGIAWAVTFTFVLSLH